MQEFCFTPIAVAKTCYTEKFGIPRQAGLAPSARAQIHMLAPYNDPVAVAELDQCSHIWLQFIFHQNKHSKWRPKVRPPRLGGNSSIGVFASRSPYRPNPIGLSVVQLEAIECVEGNVVLHVRGIDILNDTPIIDIKPYVPYSDCLPMATNSIAPNAPGLVPVFFSRASEEFLSSNTACGGKHLVELKTLIIESLGQDPRPSYQQVDPLRLYGMALEGVNVKWRYRHEEGVLQIFVVELTVLGSD